MVRHEVFKVLLPLLISSACSFTITSFTTSVDLMQRAKAYDNVLLLKSSARSDENLPLDDDKSSSSSAPRGKQISQNSREQQREKQEIKKRRFPTGQELTSLRADLEALRDNLKWADALQDEERIYDLRKAIKNGEKQDPEYVYRNARISIARAKADNTKTDEERQKNVQFWKDEAAAARSCLDRFNMEGLWVGNYGNGPQLINITYSGDTLTATKVTGDINVPRGETSFVADLAPDAPRPRNATNFNKFNGKGRIAQPNFVNSKYVPGEITINDDKHFSFLWVGKKHHIYFVRPSPMLTIRLLRNIISMEDELENMRDHLEKCLDMDMTTSLARQYANAGDDEPFRRIPLQEEINAMATRESSQINDRYNSNVYSKNEDNPLHQWAESADKASQKNRNNKRNDAGFNFLELNKWKKYIDRVLGAEDENQKL